MGVRLIGGVNRGARIWAEDDFLPPEWTEEAACAGLDPEIFFPTADENMRDHFGVTGRGAEQIANVRARAAIEKAKAVCRTCTVSAECLLYALGRREDHGIWGGYTTVERYEMLRARSAVGA